MLDKTQEHDLVDIRCLARRLRLPATWLRGEAEAGRIPSLLIGRKRRFSLNAVADVLARRAAETERIADSLPNIAQGKADL